MKKTNLVLGGSGMIGGELCKYLKHIGEEVINLDLLEGFDLRTNDLSQFNHVDYVWFLAWDVGGSKYLSAQQNLLDIIRNNTLICSQVFSFLEQTKLPFVFASSQLADIGNTYGITKILGEEWTRLLGGKIVRFWNVYGWEKPSERSHVIPDFVMSALTKGEINVLTNGEEERQFIYTSDCVRNLYKLREINALEFDLSNGNWYSIKDIATLIADKTNSKVNFGETKGYQNKINPVKNVDTFDFKIDLNEGIDLIISEAERHLKK